MTRLDGGPGFTFDEDDLPVGRLLTRREMVRMVGIGTPALALGVGCGGGRSGDDPVGDVGDGTTACSARPRLTEGPYYVDTDLNRSDIRSDAASGAVQEGLPFELRFAVSRLAAGACTPLEDALVDVWHCNALGVYSGVQDPSFGSTLGQTWLRGYQLADANGSATFTTVFPGWYQGRATHIHFNIRSSGAGASYDFTSQLFFDESLLTEVYTSVAPYTEKGDAGRLRNANDGIYEQGGTRLLLNPVRSGGGYAATFDVGLVI